MNEIDALAAFLRAIPTGKVVDKTRLTTLLASAWAELGGEVVASTWSDKLAGRIEGPEWSPPVLRFTLERHGALALGSSRAELHHWAVNVETRDATLERTGFRQQRPNDARLDVGPLVTMVVERITHAVEDDALDWSRDGRRVRINVGKVVPTTNKQTTAARRSRFGAAVEERLREAGWHLLVGSRPHTYERDADLLRT